MRAISYSIIIGVLFTVSILLMHQSLPKRAFTTVVILTGIHLVALLIVHFIQPQRRKTISFYQTCFTIILLLPVFLSMRLDALLKPEIVTRFFIVTPVSYLILFTTVVFSIHIYKFSDPS